MEYSEYREALKESVYRQIPRNHAAWQQDVWQRLVRPQFTDYHKKELRKVRPACAISNLSLAVAHRIRLDIFGILPDGTFAYGAPDVREAIVTDLLPSLDAVDPCDVEEALNLCITQTGYKLHRWGTLTQLQSLTRLCETIPEHRLEDYELQVRAALGMAVHTAAVHECDMETKPNFRTVFDKAKLLRETTALGERLWSLHIQPDDWQ